MTIKHKAIPPTTSLINLDKQQQERYDKDLHLLQEDIEVRRLILDVVKEHLPGMDIANSLISGEILRSIDGASQVTLTLHDLGRALLNSKAFYDEKGRLRKIDIRLDGLDFRLVKVDKQGDDFSLTFEDKAVNLLRDKKGPRKASSRAKVTRAEYILQLVKSVRGYHIPYRINELHKRQPIATMTPEDRSKRIDAKRTKKERDKVRGKGFSSDFKMKGVSPSMLDNMTVALDEAEKVGASERAMLVMLVAGFGESGWYMSAKNTSKGDHEGVFQADQNYSGPGGPIPPDQLRTQAHYFFVGGRSFAKGGAIEAVKNKTWTVGRVAAHVEVSDGSASYYDGFFKQARKILDAWGGGSSQTGKQRRKHYTFFVNNRETYWDAITRMAQEVSWRAFVTSGIFYYISETDLFASRARYSFGESSPGVINIDFSHDERRTAKTATATVRINRWAIPPGVCVNLKDMGPASGKWLVENTTRNLFSAEATLDLKQPMQEQREPFPGTTSGQAAGAHDGGASKQLDNQLWWPLAVEGTRGGGIKDHHARAFGNWMSDDAVDILCPMNTDVFTTEDCKVTKLTGSWIGMDANPNGYNVYIEGPDGRTWFYTHLIKREKLHVGQKLPGGTKIGESGGAAGVKHLHIACGPEVGGKVTDSRNVEKLLYPTGPKKSRPFIKDHGHV